MAGRVSKSTIQSPWRFALQTRKQLNTKDSHILPRSPHLELRFPETWTRDHLEWFNVDFDPLRFHLLPCAFSPNPNDPNSEVPDELLKTIVALVDKYRDILPHPEWDCTSPPTKSRKNWIEVSSRPSCTIQLLVKSIIEELLRFCSNGCASIESQKGDEMLKIRYAGHYFVKEKPDGVYRLQGQRRLSVETNSKYLYGRTDIANEELEYCNAAHVFSDMLGMAQIYESSDPAQDQSKRSDETLPSNSDSERLHKPSSREFFVVNVLNFELRLFWCLIPEDYVEHMAQSGRTPKTMRLMMHQTRKHSLLSVDSIKEFIAEFIRAYPRFSIPQE